MRENNSHEPDAVETDGGTATQAAQAHQSTNYLDQEVNILNPSTAFMRDHLRLVWSGFVVWALIVFGPVTMTAVAPGVMTSTIVPVIGFPLHYFLVSLGAPTGALILAAVYARQRDKLDEKYGIDHDTGGPEPSDSEAGDAAATDGGVDE